MQDIQGQELQAKQQLVSTFNKVAEHYDCPALRLFPFTADKLVSTVNVCPEMKVLDIACGTGAVATAIAQVIAPAAGRVFAIDLAVNMLDQAEAQLIKMNLQNVDLHQMDAEKLDFRKEYFDLAISSFGLFFMTDMPAALKEWLRVIKPGGQLIFTSFGDSAFQPMAKMFFEDLQSVGVAVDKNPNVETLQQAEQCKALMEQAGTTDVSVETVQMGYHLAGVQDWWEIVSHSGFRRHIEQIDRLELEAFRQQHLESIAGLVTEKGIWMDVTVLITRARKPA